MKYRKLACFEHQFDQIACRTLYIHNDTDLRLFPRLYDKIQRIIPEAMLRELLLHYFY